MTVGASGLVNSAAEPIRAYYALLGAADKFTTEEATDPHAWTVAPARQYAVVLPLVPWPLETDEEPEFQLEPAENLQCTANGSIRYSRKGQTIFSLILNKQTTLPPKHRLPVTSTDLGGYQSQMRETIRQPLAARGRSRTRRLRGLSPFFAPT